MKFKRLISVLPKNVATVVSEK